MQAILPVTARTCWRPASRPGRRPATRLHALPQRPRVSAFAADVAVAEEEAATAPAEVAPADLPPLAIPIIPAAGWLAPETNGAPPPALADALMAAATEYGMFQIVDHGVSLKLLANLRTAQRAFFSLPLVSCGSGCACGTLHSRAYGAPCALCCSRSGVAAVLLPALAVSFSSILCFGCPSLSLSRTRAGQKDGCAPHRAQPPRLLQRRLPAKGGLLKIMLLAGVRLLVDVVV